MSSKKRKKEHYSEPDCIDTDTIRTGAGNEPEDLCLSDSQDPEWSPDPMEDLKERITALEQEKQGIADRLLRTMAEFDNYRKRVTREKAELAQYGTERMAVEILPVVDNFERALEQSRQVADIDPVIVGLEMILKQLMDVLKKFHVTPFDSIGEQFNPEVHEAMAQQEHNDHADNTVIDQFQKGYMLGEKLLRPARVLVARCPDENSQ